MGTVEYVLIGVGVLLVVAAIIVGIIGHVRQPKANQAPEAATKPQAEPEAAPQPEVVAEPQPEVESQPETAVEPQIEVAPQPEVVAEPQPAAVVEQPPQAVAEKAGTDDNARVIAAFEGGRVKDSENGAFVRAADGTASYYRYNKSFTAKLIQASDEVREYYNALKNHVLSYNKVATRISWNHESVNRGRDKICRFVLRGKSLYLYLPLDPDKYIDSKYKVERVDAKRFEDFPCLYRIKNPRRVKYSCELITTIMEKYGLESTEKESTDFCEDYPYEETLPLIKRGLIKLTKTKRKVKPEELPEMPVVTETTERKVEPRAIVEAHEVKALMADDVANALVVQSVRKADPTKKGIINVDVLSKCFKDGEMVTLDEIKKRVKGFDKKVTYIKVLARGKLDKRLMVEGDEFSDDAKKMILLTGGQVIKTTT